MAPLMRPRAKGLPARSAWLLTSDGVRLSAHHDPHHPGPDDGERAGAKDLAVVVAHGFTLSWRAQASRRIASLLQEQAGVVSFDFRGHGASGGRSTVGDREVLDLDAAVRWARLLGYHRVVTLGWSMGASVAVRHAGLVGVGTKQRVDAVASVSGPSRWHYRGTPAMRRLHTGVMTPAGRVVVRHLFGTRISTVGWDPEPEAPAALAARITVPFLVAHGDADAFFPLEHAQALHAAAPVSQLWVEEGFGHAEIAASDDLVRRITGWLDTSSRTEPAATP